MNNFPDPEVFLQELENNVTEIIDEVEAFEQNREQYIAAMELTKYYNKKKYYWKYCGMESDPFFLSGNAIFRVHGKI
jgi:hypothetical protein